MLTGESNTVPVSVISLAQKALMVFCDGLFVLGPFAKCLTAFICPYSKSVKKKKTNSTQDERLCSQTYSRSIYHHQRY